MKAEQINELIARDCPEVVEWHDCRPYWSGAWSASQYDDARDAEFNPAYDANAVRCAILKLTCGHGAHQRGGAYRYLAELCKVCTGYDGAHWTEMEMVNWFSMFTASPLQQCEAYLRAVGKWGNV